MNTIPSSGGNKLACLTQVFGLPLANGFPKHSLVLRIFNTLVSKGIGMDDSASAHSATNTSDNEIDQILVAISDLKSLAYFQHLVLSERMQQSEERDALFTLHYALCDQLEALKKTCGVLQRVVDPQPITNNIRLLD